MIRLWHSIRKLPSPGVPLLVRLRDGRLIHAERPKYVANYEAADLGYRTGDGYELSTDAGRPDDAVEWSIL